MTFATYCSACDAGECHNCDPGHTREGLIGGWRCVCDHDSERRERRRERFANSTYARVLADSKRERIPVPSEDDR